MHAGVGEGLLQARESRFLETAQGRVALVSVASTFPDHSRAGRSRGDVPSRPGLAPQRYTTTRIITAEQMERFREALRDVGIRAGGGDQLRVLGTRFAVGEEPGSQSEPHEEDLA